jgi:hypothetical protein
VLDHVLPDDRRVYRDWDLALDTPKKEVLEPEVVQLLSGVIAEKRLTGKRHNRAAASRDLSAADDWISAATGSSEQARKYHAYLRQVAQDAVDGNWRLIEQLAEQLLVRQKISGREVSELLRGMLRGGGVVELLGP